MVDRATIIQIGDVHFADFANLRAVVDDKDDFGTPGNVAAAFATPIPAIIARTIEEELHRSPEAIVAICGDLANRGDLADFERAIDFLQSSLGGRGEFAADRVHVVPGNHDVDLNNEMKFVGLGPERFAVLQDRAGAAGSAMIITDNHRETSHVFGRGGLHIHSVNTALANGAPRLIANIGAADPIAKALRSFDSVNLLTDADSLAVEVAKSNPDFAIQESLDMPIITPDVLHKVQSSVSTAPPGLVVLIAHHGFLPQATPRFGPYTEMVNGGQVRRRLLQLNRPVLYLHGHIHEDVVEMIRGTGAGLPSVGWPVIAIAAPLLSDGFNRIEVEYARDGRVLGLVLHRLRVDAGAGAIVRMAPERISIGTRKTIDVRHRKFFLEVMRAYGMSGADLVRIGAESDPAMSDLEVEDVVSEAVWAGILESASDERDPFVTREFLFR